MNNNLNSINSLNSSTDRVALLPKNPNTFFVFWQFSDARTKLFMSGSYKNEIILKLFNAEDRTCIAEFKFRWDTFKAYISYPVTPSENQTSGHPDVTLGFPYPKNARLPSNLSGADVFKGGQATSVYAVAFAETISGSIETLAESNVFAICPASAGTQNFLTDNSEYYRKVVV